MDEKLSKRQVLRLLKGASSDFGRTGRDTAARFQLKWKDAAKAAGASEKEWRAAMSEGEADGRRRANPGLLDRLRSVLRRR